LSPEERAEVQEILYEAGIADEEAEHEIIIRREVSAGGKSRIFINDRSVTLAILRRLQPLLVEIHGQGEQKLLLSSRAQMELLDAYAGCQALRAEVGEAFEHWKKAVAALAGLRAEMQERVRLTDRLEEQLAEIDAVAPQTGEEERLITARRLMVHAERIVQLCGGSYDQLYESDTSVLARLAGIIKQIRELTLIDPRVLPLLNNLEEGSALLSEAAGGVRSYLETVEFSPEELERVDDRLAELERLKRKLGADLDGILLIREQVAQELSRFADMTERERQLQTELHEAQEAYSVRAQQLSQTRREGARRLERGVLKDLKQVALEDAQFVVELKSSAPAAVTHASDEAPGSVAEEDGFYTPYGADRISLLFNANPGESLRTVGQAASGGELSRLMLTLLTVSLKGSGQRLGSETLIFDEIDTGIGGGVAEAIGRRLKALAETNQVLCVTHQPQIARFADAHYSVKKGVREGRTLTSVEQLEGEARVRELARMIAGERESKTTLDTARWMLETAQT
jgi:DNA repair protein RecN (Recombination protein N)